jgi:hypothetical protein
VQEEKIYRVTFLVPTLIDVKANTIMEVAEWAEYEKRRMDEGTMLYKIVALPEKKPA